MVVPQVEHRLQGVHARASVLLRACGEYRVLLARKHAASLESDAGLDRFHEESAESAILCSCLMGLVAGADAARRGSGVCRGRTATRGRAARPFLVHAALSSAHAWAPRDPSRAAEAAAGRDAAGASLAPVKDARSALLSRPAARGGRLPVLRALQAAAADDARDAVRGLAGAALSKARALSVGGDGTATLPAPSVRAVVADLGRDAVYAPRTTAAALAFALDLGGDADEPASTSAVAAAASHVSCAALLRCAGAGSVPHEAAAAVVGAPAWSEISALWLLDAGAALVSAPPLARTRAPRHTHTH